MIVAEAEVSVAAEIEPKIFHSIAVGLRDGEQQKKVNAEIPIPDRLTAFDADVNMGFRRIEVGCLTNPVDQAFTRAVIGHIDERIAAGDERYGEIEIQGLFQAMPDKVEQGLAALEGFDPERVRLHIYDRVSPHLRGLATDHDNPEAEDGRTNTAEYSIQEAAERTIDTARVALAAGYTRFSFSGEGAVEPFVDPDEVIDNFYIPIGQAVSAEGATAINFNLPFTFGDLGIVEWDEDGLRDFDGRVKAAVPGVTTTIHVHDDSSGAVEAVEAGRRAGMDGAEYTTYGNGERTGNAAFVRFMHRAIAYARETIETRERIESYKAAGKRVNPKAVERVERHEAFWRRNKLAASIVDAMHNNYQMCVAVAEVYGSEDRFEATQLGNPHVLDAGSGPHGQANVIYAERPVEHPVWMGYDRVALALDMQGHPGARKIIEVDPDYMQEVTLQTHAAGRHTNRIHDHRVVFAPEAERRKAIDMAREKEERIRALMRA